MGLWDAWREQSYVFFHALVVQAVPQLESFTMGGLLGLAWGSAASGVDVELITTIQNEVLARLEQVDLRSGAELSRKALCRTRSVGFGLPICGVRRPQLVDIRTARDKAGGSHHGLSSWPKSFPACEGMGGLRSSEADW
ncbi:unnamed protein product [Polarella glacialis]|uniref:Uncharacterized protein n=1 Tax=Polarella glacialis TaxID=89957 RepID=A0A813HLY2_POLGL|nr:unnamed protein product [Polarella glacialis]